jgi:hypothetical protein
VSTLPRIANTETPKPVSTSTPPVTSGHASDYSWLAGEVQQYRLAKGWQLRYAGVDEVDAHGGSVLLISDTDQLSQLKEGQRVRVSGRLLYPDSHTSGTPFQVQSLQILSK